MIVEQGVPVSVLIIGRRRRVVDKAATALRGEGFAAAGVTADEDAARLLAAGGVTALVIGGGVGPVSRERLAGLARAAGAAVIHGRIGFGGVRSYVRKRLIPELRRGPAA
ncbi:hypothetical protein [Streptomyces sp. NBC_01803]|uniref:hypothetical protein n=1 Tax=Streptomyces sp. NBC_01803 TaxID=2975946 RepID=UPI002DDA72A7|nr:hypothetical protein [Streptomyces sp. NBC_01803]WSA46078.1 hypothetical protein OIE51_18875 [Streptomyces sp. NBC_01803]